MKITGLKQFLNEMPKVELHIHLEGSIPLEALCTLVNKYRGEKQVTTVNWLKARFRYKDFPHFIETWYWKNQFLREYEDFEYIAERIAADLTRQNIQYAEMFFSPGDFTKFKLDPRELTAVIRRGLDRHSGKIKIRLIADLIRDFGPQRGAGWLEQLAEVQDQGVIGIGIGGSEHQFPPEPYSKVYGRARELGFRTTAHAGEVGNADSIWGALNALKVDRIGHGTAAKGDEHLIEFLIRQQIPVEMCPVSNVRTGTVRNIGSHPVKDFLRRGMLVSVNTDDPKMFNTSLEHEFAELINSQGLTKNQMLQLLENAIKSLWCSEAEKLELFTEISTYFNNNSYIE